MKTRRLQDWEKLKKYVPIHKQEDVCPNGVPALVERDNNDDDSDSEESVVPCALLHPVHRPRASSVLRNVTPAPTHTFLKRHFLTEISKSIHIPPPPPTEKFGATDQKSRKPRKNAKTHCVGTLMNVPERYASCPFPYSRKCTKSPSMGMPVHALVPFPSSEWLTAPTPTAPTTPTSVRADWPTNRFPSPIPRPSLPPILTTTSNYFGNQFSKLPSFTCL